MGFSPHSAIAGPLPRLCRTPRHASAVLAPTCSPGESCANTAKLASRSSLSPGSTYTPCPSRWSHPVAAKRAACFAWMPCLLSVAVVNGVPRGRSSNACRNNKLGEVPMRRSFYNFFIQINRQTVCVSGNNEPQKQSIWIKFHLKFPPRKNFGTFFIRSEFLKISCRANQNDASELTDTHHPKSTDSTPHTCKMKQ